MLTSDVLLGEGWLFGTLIMALSMSAKLRPADSEIRMVP